MEIRLTFTKEEKNYLKKFKNLKNKLLVGKQHFKKIIMVLKLFTIYRDFRENIVFFNKKPLI